MLIKDIKGTRSYVTVYLEDRSIVIQGELTLTPAFYANKNSISKWNEPYQNIVITDKEKDELVQKIIQFTDNLEIKILFED